jgi:hypothetical protein
MRALLKVVIALCLVLGSTVGLTVWRLSRGPVSLAAVQPLLQDLLHRGSPFVARFADPTLVWSREDGTLALAVKDLDIRTPGGDFVAGAPSALVEVAAWPLLVERRIEPVRVTLALPEFELTRTAGGELVLAFAGELAALPLSEAAGGGGLDALFGGKTPAGGAGLPSLQRVRVTAPALRFLDEATERRAEARNPVFEIERDGQAWAASLASTFGEGRIELAAETGAGADELLVMVDLDQFPTQDLAGILGQLPLAEVELPVSGWVGFTLDRATDVPGPAAFDLVAGAASVSLPDVGLGPLLIREANLKGQLAAGWRAVEIDTLQVHGQDYSFTASGNIAYGEAGPEGQLRFEARDLDVSDILAFWPRNAAAAARAWVADNVPAGRITKADIDLGHGAERPGQPEIGGSFAFGGVELRWLPTMPPATRLTGTGSFAAKSIGLKLTGGRVGEVELTGGEAMLANAWGGPPTPRLKASFNLRSSLAAAFRLLNNPPVSLGKVTSLTAQVVGGRQTTMIEVGLPLVADPPPHEVRYKATARLTDLSVKDVRPGYSVAAQNLTFVAEPASLSASSDIRLNGVPLTVSWRENLADPGREARRLELQGTADQAAVQALGFDWPERLSGQIGIKATVVQAANPMRTVDLALDLRQAGVRFPEILLTKRMGQPGEASARLVQPDQRSMNIDRARLELGNLVAEGTAGMRLEPLRLERVALREARGLLGDLTADLSLRQGKWRGRVDIGRLDLRPVLQADTGSGGGTVPTLPDVALDVTARQLRFGNAPFDNLAGMVERAGGIWSAASLRSRIEGSEVSLDLQTRNRLGALTLRADDAGWLIRSFASSDGGIRGGRFRLSAELRDGRGGPSGSGELRIRNFTLYGTPLVARIVSLASFSGLGNALGGRGVPVDRLVAPFTLEGGRIRLQQARLVGSDIGARADGAIDLATRRLDISGTVAPAYTVNRILGRIPIVGQILSGSRSDAALAATFSVTGPFAEPRVSVNPLSVLVPGMVRDFFAALAADTTSDLAPIDQR